MIVYIYGFFCENVVCIVTYASHFSNLHLNMLHGFKTQIKTSKSLFIVFPSSFCCHWQLVRNIFWSKPIERRIFNQSFRAIRVFLNNLQATGTRSDFRWKFECFIIEVLAYLFAWLDYFEYFLFYIRIHAGVFLWLIIYIHMTNFIIQHEFRITNLMNFNEAH